ncbi:hypothetical protein PV325_008159 [Microctonus aethiopoides]|nr:hypothetical protein PV325_008159 [Microctonus aethiopoides]
MNKTRLYCAVPDCKSKASVNVDLSYHRFPLSDKYNENVTNYFGDVEKVGLYSQWKKVTNIPNPGPNDRICSQHFTAADYCGNGVRNQRRRLKYNAIPSLHLPIINKERNERNEKRHARTLRILKREHQAVDAAGGAVDDDADDEDGKLKRKGVGDAEAGDARRSGDTGRAGEAEAGDAEVGDAERVGNAERRRPRLIVINHYRLGHTSNLGGGL